MTPAQQACISHAAGVTKLDPAAITASPTASTKTGGTILTTSAGGVDYNCVVESDGKVSSFKKMK